jgi:hypothetical protein
MRWAFLVGLGSAVVVAAGVIAGFLALRPAEADTIGPGIQDPIPGRFVDPEQLREYHDLTARQQASVSRTAKKLEVAAELIRGETTLSDAAARFREIVQSDPAALASLRVMCPGGTDEERYYWNVIGFVRGLARIEPGRVPALVGKLEAEVRARFPATPSGVIPAA